MGSNSDFRSEIRVHMQTNKLLVRIRSYIYVLICRLKVCILGIADLLML